MPKRRTLVEALAETRALRGDRAAAAERISRATRVAHAPRPPLSAVGGYVSAADNYAQRVLKLAEKHVLARLPVLGSGDPLDRAGLELGLAAMQIDMLALAEKMRRPARVAGKRSAKHAQREVARMMGLKRIDAPGTDWLVEDFAARSVGYFRNIAAAQVEQVRKAIAEHEEGDSLRADILHSLWVSRNRSKLIASDQAYKLQANQVEQWARGVGSEGYIWVESVSADRRHEHIPRYGKFFRWDAPPPDGHPGTQPNCKCSTLPAESPVLL